MNKTSLVLSAIVLSALALVSCNSSGSSSKPPPKVVLDMPPIELGEKGWQTFPSPRGFDFPGAMFALDDQGIWRPFPQAGKTYQKQGELSVPKISKTNKWGVNVLFNYAGVDPAGLDASIGDTVTVNVEFEGGVRFFDPEFYTKTLAAAKNLMPATPEKGWRYFVIESTTAFKTVSVTAVGDAGGGVKVNGVISKIFKANAGFEKKNGNDTSLVKTFPTEQNVFYLVHEIVKTPGAFGGTSVTTSKVVDDKLPVKVAPPAQ